MPTRHTSFLEGNQSLIVLTTIAIAIMAMWFIPWTAPLLDQLDEFVFYTLNGSLAWGYYWQAYWAFGNHRAFDATMAVVYASLFVGYCFFRTDREMAGRRFAELVVLMLTLGLVLLVVHELFVLLQYKRPSPTRVLEPAIRLSEVFEGWKVKDRSSSSFPGDHALVSLYLCLYFLTRSTRAYALLFLGVAVVAILPRLVGGAHWVTDVIAGSFFFAAIAWFAVEGSGLFDWMASKIQRFTNWLVHPIHGWINRWGFWRAEG